MFDARKRLNERVRRFLDWMKVCNQVDQYVGENSDYFTVDIGWFHVKFDETERKDEDER